LLAEHRLFHHLFADLRLAAHRSRDITGSVL
jgi:hypothetical protein